MFNFLLMIIRIVFIFIPKHKKDIIIENIILKKENEILKRKNKKRIKFKFSDRVFYAIYNKFSKIAAKFIIGHLEKLLFFKNNRCFSRYMPDMGINL